MADTTNPVLAAIAVLREQRADLLRQVADIDAQLAEVARALGVSARTPNSGEVSRQAIWMRERAARHRANGLCRRRSQPALRKPDGSLASLCVRHLDVMRDDARKRKGYKGNVGFMTIPRPSEAEGRS